MAKQFVGPTSSFTWLDYSEHDRQKALEVVRLFAEKGTVDELGIGTVRDAFSDLLFPGTSTLHTRARYFFFIPWIYRHLEGREWKSGAEVTAHARRDEIALVNALAESDDTEGVIGIEARDSLKNLPSLLYWQGLQIHGFRLLDLGRASFHRRLATPRARRPDLGSGDEESIEKPQVASWHPGIPAAPTGFPKEASFRLTPGEARFFQDRARERIGRTLLAWLLNEGSGLEGAEFPWEHPRLDSMRAEHRLQVTHAQNFSDAMRGAPLLYNLMLAELAQRDDLAELYREELAAWTDLMTQHSSPLQRWDRDAMWSLVLRQNPRIPHRTQEFVGRWLSIACGRPDAAVLARDASIRSMIEARERVLKGAQARLANRRALELWGGESGTAPLSYRWRNVQRLVNDVLSAT